MIVLFRRFFGFISAALGGAPRRGDVPQREDAVLGAKGEAFAAAYLRREGYQVLERNARLPVGEADLIARSPSGARVLVEVKTRARGKNSRSDRATPEMAITRHKRRKLRAIAAYLGKANNWGRVRVDVIAVEWPADGDEPTLRHHKDVM